MTSTLRIAAGVTRLHLRIYYCARISTAALLRRETRNMASREIESYQHDPRAEEHNSLEYAQSKRFDLLTNEWRHLMSAPCSRQSQIRAQKICVCILVSVIRADYWAKTA